MTTFWEIEVYKFGSWRRSSLLGFRHRIESEEEALELFERYKALSDRPCRLIKMVQYVVESAEPVLKQRYESL